jgi:hypothetical protein
VPTPTPITVPPAVWPHAPGSLTAHQMACGYWQVRDSREIIVATLYSSNPAAVENVVAAVLDYARCRAAADGTDPDAATAAALAARVDAGESLAACLAAPAHDLGEAGA